MLDRKLIRDLWRLRGQVIAIALIVASGIALLVMSLTSLEALRETADAYYERYRFAGVFADVKRAPAPLAHRIEAIPGVQAAETRITEQAVIDVSGFAEPVMAVLVSLPEEGQPILNRLALERGRWVAPNRDDQVIVSTPFAESHGLELGDQVSVIMRGNKRKMTIVGMALSPEFVYAIGPGALMPDDQRYGVFWIGRKTMEAAYDLDGAFNNVTLSLLRGTNPKDVVERLDLLLARYGGIGAYERKDQISHWFLMNELEQLRSMARILPSIFLLVAAFLTNMILARLIAIERSEIGLLKAFGYSNFAVGWHYAKMAVAMTALGVLLGWALGFWLGRYNTGIYAELFHFPFLLFRPGPDSFATAALVSLAASLAGAMIAVRGAVSLSPAEAMQPPAPPSFRHHGSASGRGRSARNWIDQPTRMIFRQVLRWPLRAAATITGVGLAVAVMITSLHWVDAIDHMIDIDFFQAQRQDMTVGLSEAQGQRVALEFATLPGVLAAEGSRTVVASFHSGTRRHRGSIEGISADARLQVVYDADGGIVRPPPDGLILSEMLAQKLAVSVGDQVWVEVLEGRRPNTQLTVAGVFETYFGMPAYMELEALNRIMREPHRVATLALLVDRTQEVTLFAELKDLPEVAAVALRRALVDRFNETMGRSLLVFVGFFIVFASTLSVGVVYNAARIALSERGRELATLRVLGFSRWEISYILLGETGLLIAIALPLGCLFGLTLAWFISLGFESELFRVPLAITPATFGVAVATTLVSTLLSGLLVRRRLDQLDLIEVLKTRE
ncbi:ABC transporter permease [Pelagibius sp. Alg239-R121]|uniref:ABC transporter permease n=1 Tax=Pelagibius sp. Alg239-R121 TaxID=2993448 RepID=UPI0024A6B29D|nr:ABC transporter permease [Pelagibius sp. Alg239-R121]